MGISSQKPAQLENSRGNELFETKKDNKELKQLDSLLFDMLK